MSKTTETIIRPKRGLAIDYRELWHYRELFYFLSWRDIKLRYKQTVLGVIWAVLQPFMMMVIFSFIFGKVAKVPSYGIPYPIFSYAGLLLWGIFSNSLSNASQSLISNTNIVQKVYLPRIILPASSIIVTVVDFLFSFLVFGVILIYYQFMPNLLGLLLLPLFLLITITASLGLGSFLAAFNVKYRDVRYALPFFIQLMIYITPVIYPINIVSDKYRWILALNPMTGAIEGFKAAFLGTAAIDWSVIGISAAVSVALLAFGFWYFSKTERIFADLI